MWSCQTLLDNFTKSGASVAVPMGLCALDECTCLMIARTRAMTCLPIKLEKYGIQFYVVVGHQFCYLGSFFENGAGNNTGVSGPTD